MHDSHHICQCVRETYTYSLLTMHAGTSVSDFQKNDWDTRESHNAGQGVHMHTHEPQPSYINQHALRYVMHTFSRVCMGARIIESTRILHIYSNSPAVYSNGYNIVTVKSTRWLSAADLNLTRTQSYQRSSIYDLWSWPQTQHGRSCGWITSPLRVSIGHA